MSLVLNLRGTNGSGKSTAARSLLNGGGVTVMIGGTKCTANDDVCLIGPYPKGMVTGGCDRIKTTDLMRAAVEEASRCYSLVLFEGILVGTSFGPWAEFCRDRVPFWWLFLDTPMQMCVDRVGQRNGGKPFNVWEVEDKHKRIGRARQRAIEAGFTVIDIHHEKANEELAALALLG